MQIPHLLSVLVVALLANTTLLANDPPPPPPPPMAACCAAGKDAKAGSATQQTLSPKEILAQADAARGNLGGVSWTVEISEGEDGEEVRVIDVKAKGFDMRAVTLSPPKQKDHKLLLLRNNMWFHTPNVSRPVPISLRSKLSGKAANGDIASTNYAEDYEVLEMVEEDLNGTPCYRFELKATSRNVTYSRIRYWISKEHLTGIRAEYYNTDGSKKIKEAEMRYDNSVEIAGHSRPFISEMLIRDSLLADAVTRLSFSDPELGEISPRIFNLQALGQ